MARNITPVVALNKDAKVIGYFESISAAARYMGTNYVNVNNRLMMGKPYKQILFMREREFRELYLKGDTDKLKFKSRKEAMHERAIKIWKSMSKDKRSEYLQKLAESRRQWFEKNRGAAIEAFSRRRKPVIDTLTGTVYPSISEAARRIGSTTQRVHADINRGYISQDKYKFEYYYEKSEERSAV